MRYSTGEMCGKKPVSRIPAFPEDSGLLSIDFVIGLSIFMIAFVIVATMTAGILVGLQSRPIDYDAVAYRTGVILVEDPGEIEEKVGESSIAPDRYAWDLIYPEYEEQYYHYYENNIMRMGLMIPRYYYDTPPRILMIHKVTEFFNSTKYGAYYQDKVIFGNYPYRFNVSLIMMDGSPSPAPIGDPIPENSTTGYIRRVVMVKNTTGLTITNLYRENLSGSITVTYDFRNVSEGNPAYMVYPSLERTVINLTNFTEPDTYNMTYLQVCSPTCENPSPDSPTILLRNYSNPSDIKRFPTIGVGMWEPVSNTSYLEIEPGYFSRRYFPNIGPIDSIDVKMTIRSSNETNTTYIGGTYDYYYSIATANFTQSDLAPAVLEVRVW